MQAASGWVLGMLFLAFASISAQTTYTWNPASGTWSTVTGWTPNSPVGGPGAADSITFTDGGSGTINLNIETSRTVNVISKPGVRRWDISNGGASLATLTADTIVGTQTNFIFRNGAGGMAVNTRNLTVSAGVTFFGSTSDSAGNPINNLTVSGTTAVSGGTLNMNVQNVSTSHTYSLGVLNSTGGLINLANRASNASPATTTANTTGLVGTGGTIQATPTAGFTNISATLAINNDSDYSSATLLRDGTTASAVLRLTKSGTGTQALTATNTYTGPTTINEGTLKMGNGGATGSITSNVNMTSTDATFAIDRANNTSQSTSGTFANTISGSGRLLKLGTGVHFLSGNNTYTGDTVIENGGLQVFSDANLGDASSNIVFNNGANTARIETAQSATIARDVIINGTQARFGITGTTNVSTFSGEISGAGGMDKRFVGTLILTNANTYQGGTVITTGTLAAQNTAGSATGTGGVTVAAGMVLAGDGIIAPDAGNNITVAGNINPGLDSTATLTFGLGGASKLDFQGGSFLNFALGTDSDLVDFATAGDWLSGTGNVTLNLTLGDGFSYDDSYVIFSDVTTTAFTLAGITGYDTGSYLASFEQVGDNYIVSFDAVPEPSTWMLLGFGLAFLLWRSHRRRTVG